MRLLRTVSTVAVHGAIVLGCGGHAPQGPRDGAVQTSDPRGEYEDGPYHCCAEGDGDACCSGRAKDCFKYGGIYGACVDVGERIEGKVICAKCCEGLTQVASGLVEGNAVPPEQDNMPEGCDRAADAPPRSILTCLACGDGRCSRDTENRCNCPTDCTVPGSSDTDQQR